MAVKRIKKELYSYSKDPFPGISLWPNPRNPEDLFHLLGSLIGPPDTPYEDCLFFISIQLPNNYPFQPPHVTFLTPIFHPNINQRGNTILDVLGTEWRPAFTVPQILRHLMALLETPNPDDPFVYEIAPLYRRSKAEFEEKAKEQAKLHAW